MENQAATFIPPGRGAKFVPTIDLWWSIDGNLWHFARAGVEAHIPAEAIAHGEHPMRLRTAPAAFRSVRQLIAALL